MKTGIYTITLSLLVISCQVKQTNETKQSSDFKIEKVAICRIDTLKTLHLQGEIYGKNTFTLLHLNNFEKDVRWIEILKDDNNIDSITLPNQSDVNGFSINKFTQSADGFDLQVEYGSRYYFLKTFHFVFNNGEFYLSGIDISTFDKDSPETAKEYREEISNSISIDRFEIVEYLKN